jgi:hypothetical protein
MADLVRSLLDEQTLAMRLRCCFANVGRKQYFVGKDAVVNITLSIDMQPYRHIGVRTFVLIFD